MNKIIYTFILLVFSHVTFANDEPEERFVFIGSQLDFHGFEPSDGCEDKSTVPSNTKGVLLEHICINMNEAFKAKYLVHQVLEGSFSGDTISFEVYDHYGTPAFSNYDTAMIYLNKYDGKWYHQKYTWDSVYETKDGRYADCSITYIDESYQSQYLKPVKFKNPVRFDISHYNKKLKSRYKSSPIYLIKDDLVTCKKGIYAEDLLIIERR